MNKTYQMIDPEDGQVKSVVCTSDAQRDAMIEAGWKMATDKKTAAKPEEQPVSK